MNTKRILPIIISICFILLILSACSKPAPPAELSEGAKENINRLISVAAEEVGYKEKADDSEMDDKEANAGSKDWNKYAEEFDELYPDWYNGKKNGYKWCDIFVDWCFVQAFGYDDALSLLCQPEHSLGAGCKYSLRYYKENGQFYKISPRVGDQIFFGLSEATCHHTGIVEKVEENIIYTIEGNSNNQVERKQYKTGSINILGFGRPDYESIGGNK